MKQEMRSPEERLAWSKVEKRARFHWTDLEQAGINTAMAQLFVRRWAKLGWIVEIDRDGGRKIYGHKGAHQVDAALIQTSKTAEDAMWKVMQRFKIFTPLDVSANASVGEIAVSEEKAKVYCGKLVATGYLKVRQTAQPGKRPATYQLIKFTGAQAPRPRKVTGIFDENTGEFHPIMRSQRS